MWTQPPCYYQNNPNNNQPQNYPDMIEREYKLLKKMRKEIREEMNPLKKDDLLKKGPTGGTSLSSTGWLILLSFASPFIMLYLFLYIFKDLLQLIQHLPVK